LSGTLDRRLRALAEAVDLADERLDAERVTAARRVVERAGERIGLGLESTIVALAGPTGAGKSSLFNALAGSDVSQVGRRRPTTAAPSAATWGDAAPELLDWLQVARRHRARNGALGGLVLLDLPDFDSVERSHWVEVDRLLELVDLLVWVVDPQKYADARLHDDYLRALARYDESMLVVLNQVDAVAGDGVPAIRDDLVGLLRGYGLGSTPVLTVSALTGEGLDRLRGTLGDAVARRAAAVARLGADVTAAAAALLDECAPSARPELPKEDGKRVRDALADAAGVPTVVRAVASAHRRRGALATGWPFARWLKRLRPDPLRRLRLPDQPAPEAGTSLPGTSPVQREQVAAATRALAAAASRELPAPWPNVVRRAATAREEQVADRLDRAVAGADLHVERPRWWWLAGALQKLLSVAVVAGLLWLLALVLLAWLQLDDVVPLPEAWGIPVPTLLLLGGAAAGLVLAFLVRLVNGAAARRRARAAERSLRARVDEVAEELVLGPVQAELDAHRRLCDLLAEAS
jgi:GTP-binding protein EngB required for normal cell division